MAANKLICSYPGPAVEIPSEIAADPEFLKELASFLVQMDTDVLDTAAKITKAGSTVAEVREPASALYITELLVAILRGIGSEAQITRITKRVADDVLWNKAYIPWRRSALWLVLRIALQTSLPTTLDYKAFMLCFHTTLLEQAVKNNFSSDLIFVMRAKVARRFYKIRDAAPIFVGRAVKDTVELAEEVLQQRWLETQLDDERTPKFAPEMIDPGADTSLSLHKSKGYLLHALRAQHYAMPLSTFTPSHTPRVLTQDFASYENNHLIRAVEADQRIALADFEVSVEEHLDAWVQGSTWNDTACEVLASCFSQYAMAAGKVYTVDALDRSLMILTLMDIWVAVDKIVTTKCPLLLNYTPEIPKAFLEPLLLRTSANHHRSLLIERYLASRHAAASANLSVFSDSVDSKCFGVQYFRQSPSHQMLKLSIETNAEADRDRKRVELREKNDKYRSIMARAADMEHNYQQKPNGNVKHKQKMCKRCLVEREAKALGICAHEWPLPEHELEAERTVFELACPPVIAIWRALTYHILCDIGIPDKRAQRAQPPVVLDGYSDLAKWRKYHPLNRITLASTTKPFVKSHYAKKSLPAAESDVIVNNGLRLQLFDIQFRTWAVGPFTASNVIKHATIMLPDSSPYLYLQYGVEGTSHTSNQVIADQADCPKDISLHEHYAFGTLRSGAHLQWMNILRELSANTLTLQHDEVASLLSMAAWQIGPLSADHSSREWHVQLQDPSFGHRLITESSVILKRVEANWLEITTLRTLS